MTLISRISLIAGLAGILTGCPKAALSSAVTSTGGGEALVGTWVTDLNQVTVIELDGRKLEVSSVVDSDGEVFEVAEVAVEDGQFTWTYLVPSNGTVVKTVVVEVRGDTADTHWSNTLDAEGDEAMYRQ